MNLYALQTEINGKDTTMLTLLDSTTMAEVKNQRAILGLLKNQSEPIIHDNILYNPSFIDFFHKTMLVFAEFTAGTHPITSNGFMYVVDERCKTPEKPDQKDIIGSFEVITGVVLKDTYVANANYHFISEDGLFQLPAQIERVLFMALV
jgi:hypothetical protein